MLKKKILLSLFILLMALIGWTIWILEIIVVKKWYGLDWLNGTLYAPYFGALIACMAFALPFSINGTTIKKLLVPMLLLYFVNIICYKIGQQLCFALYCRFCIWDTTDHLLLFSMGFLLFPFMGFLYWLITTKLIRKIKKVNIIYISLLLVAGVILSILSIHLNTGFGHQTGWVDCVKMGYPVFWTIFFLGLSGSMHVRQKTI
jgi:hypothetical protein